MSSRALHPLCLSLLVSLVAACGSTSRAPVSSPQISTASSPVGEARPATNRAPSRHPQVTLKRGGGFYKDDGPADDIPANLEDTPDAIPRWEPLRKPTTRPYVVLGKAYTPFTELRPYKARGIASWYGKKFHGQKTSLGEPYDMFAMTAAHTVLPIPSYARVTSMQNGRSVIVRITDRGPFHADRIIDLSYTAAYKLGIIGNGSGEVEVEAILPGDAGGTAYAQVAPPAPARPAIQAQPLPQESMSGELGRQLQRQDSPPPAKGIYLQLGAFSNADNAENLKNHLARELDWLSDPLRININGGIHRLHLGPYATRAQAEAVAERIRQSLGFQPSFVSR